MLPYGVKGHLAGLDVRIEILGVNGNDIFCKPSLHGQELIRDIRYIKPYLRPMSSMTEEEKKEYDEFEFISASHFAHGIEAGELTEWLNSHHFDYRGLIEKGLALPAPEGMYEV